MALKTYDYLGAYNASKSSKNLLTKEAQDLLAHLHFRLLPNDEEAHRYATNVSAVNNLYPISKPYNAQLVLEYYLKTRVMQRRGELGDFLIRSRVLAECCAKDFLKKDNKDKSSLGALIKKIEMTDPKATELVTALKSIEDIRKERNTSAHYIEPVVAFNKPGITKLTL